MLTDEDKQYVESLAIEQVIPQSLKEKILTEENINAADSQGLTALHYAAQKGKVAAAKHLLSSSGQNKPANDGVTPFILAVVNNNEDLVRHFLQQPAMEQIAEDKTIRGENALICAVKAKKPDMVRLLLNDPRFKSTIHATDIFGRTALDYAVRDRQTSSIRLLLNKPAMTFVEIRAMPKYGMAFHDLSQEKVNNKLKEFLSSRGYDPRLVLDPNGNCNGWSFLYQIYLTQGKESKFYDILHALESWDGTQQELNSMNLPSSLQRKYQFTSQEDLYEQYKQKTGWFEELSKKSKNNVELADFFKAHRSPKTLWSDLRKRHLNGDLPFKAIGEDLFEKYNNRDDLFEQTINDLSLQHYNSPAAKLLGNPGFSQTTRDSLYQLAQGVHGGREVRNLFNFFNHTFNHQQLIEFLTYQSKWKGVSFVLGGNNHVTTFYVESDGSFSYYDSNNSAKVYVSTPTDLATHLMTGMFNIPITELNTKSITLNSICAYKFYKKQSEIPAVETADPSELLSPSTNLFTPLHLAIIRNDKNKISYLLQLFSKLPPIKRLMLLRQEDANKYTPLMRAVAMGNIECAKTLYTIEKLADPAISMVINNKIDFLKLNELTEKTLEELLDANLLSTNGVDKFGRSLLHSCVYKSPLFAKKLLKNEGQSLFNSRDSFGSTPLMWAVTYRAKPEIIEKFLSKKDLHINNVNNEGKTALHNAMESNASKMVVNMLLGRKNLNVNHKDASGKTALLRGLECYASESSIVLLIQDKRTEINLADNNGENALMYAIKHHASTKILKAILNRKDLNINASDSAGVTALMHAVKNNQFEKVRWLLNAGADPRRVDNNGKKVIDYTTDLLMIAIIEKYQASASLPHTKSLTQSFEKLKVKNEKLPEKSKSKKWPTVPPSGKIK